MKTSFRRWIALIGFVVLTSSAHGQDYDYYTTNGTIMIRKYNGPGGEVTIPSQINGLPVTGIGTWAFSNRGNLTAVIIGASVTSIGDGAFCGCTRLIALTVDPLNAAYGSIDGVLFNKSQTTLIQCAGGKAGSYSIPDSVTSIGDHAFYGCASLTNVTIPDSVSSIGVGACWGCASLTSLVIGNRVNSIGDSTFSGCASLTSITVPDTVTSIGDFAFDRCTSLTSVVIGNSVNSIGDGAFWGCASLTNLAIGNSVNSIGDRAFAGCSSLTSVTIPHSVASIGDDAFRWGCTGLTVITVDALNPAFSSIEGVLFNKSQTTLIRCPGGKAGSYSIPTSVTSIGDHAFYGCASLTNVTIPDGVTSIGEWAFAEGSSLTQVVIGDRLSSIGAGAFSGCASLTSITIPDSVTSIGYSAFSDCMSLTSITIPNRVISIGDRAFAGCTSLTSITVPDSVTSIGYCAFYGCASLTSVVIGKGVTSIQYGAFSGCVALKAIDVAPGNLSYSSMDGVLFDKGQAKLVKFPSGKIGVLNLPSSAVSIEADAFSDCSGLTAIDVAPDNVSYSSLDGVLFNKEQTTLLRCPAGKVGNCTIPNTLAWTPFPYVTSDAFAGCIGVTAFSVSTANPNLSGLDGVLFDKAQTVVYRCPPGKVGSYKLPNRVTQIEYRAFSDCASLTDITIPHTLTDIWDYAFYNCAGLTALYFEGDAPMLWYSVDQGGWGRPGCPIFSGADQATVYYLPESAGWGSEYGGRPVAAWLPQVLSNDSSFGVRDNQFGFTVNWARGKTVVVEAATSLVNPAWLPVSTNTLTDGSYYFSDADWANYPARFYRVRSP